MHFLLPQLNGKKGTGKRIVELLQPTIEYSRNEEANFAYYWFRKEDDEDAIWGIESYTQKSDLYDIHMKSEEFKKFAGIMGKEEIFAGDLVLTDAESAHGFLTRPGQSCPKGAFVWLVELTTVSKQGREEVLELAKPLVEHVRKNEPKTLSYLFLKDEKNDKKVWVFEMYESREALTTVHHKSEAFLKFGGQLREKNLVTDKNNTGLTALGEGFLGKHDKHIDF